MDKPKGKNANIVIFCSDPRVVKWLDDKEICRKLDIDVGSFSTIAVTGSIKFFLNEDLMNKLYKMLDILVGHFRPEKIILLNHSDCGYYKSLGQDKKENYLVDLKFVRGETSNKYEDIKIQGYLLNTETGDLKKL